jgi:retron-type reverse transcriptase
MKSEAARLLAVRRVTQDNQGKKTAGVDGVKSVKPKARLVMASEIHPTHWKQQAPQPVRRVWIVRFVPLKRLMKSGKGVRSATDLNNFISKEVRKSNLLPLPLR